jgi:gas vesicle protein
MVTRKQIYINNPQRMLVGLFVGGLAGAAAMLLFAPRSGRQTRAQIEEKSIELRDLKTRNIKNAVAQVRSKTNLITAEVRERAGELKQFGQDKLVERSDNASAVLDAGKLAVEAG